MKILIANRGEIACRIASTCRSLGIPSVAVYSDVDKEALHVEVCDEAVALGEPRSYLDIEKVLDAARKTSCTAIHPGYGFLSQSAEFVLACDKAGLVFIGPGASAMEALGDKRGARVVAHRCGVPVVPGAETCDTVEQALAAAESVGFPVLLKAAGGGGGKGMRLVEAASEINDAFFAAKREAMSSFGDDRMLVEKYIYPARHVEVQILGNGSDAIVLGERECSLQRRYQKIIEESPSPGIDEGLRAALFDSALKLAREVGYSGAGTVEFLVGPDGDYYFLEVNTRLQVEHPITECRTGVDLVALQIEVAHGGALPENIAYHGWSMEARLNAEDAFGGYLPQTGKVLGLRWPSYPWLRIDSGLKAGSSISPFYDSMVAKVIVHAPNREEATARLRLALSETVVIGLTCNRGFLLDILDRDFWSKGETYTTTIEATDFVEPEMPQVLVDVSSKINLDLPVAPRADKHSTLEQEPWRTLKGFRALG